MLFHQGMLYTNSNSSSSAGEKERGEMREMLSNTDAEIPGW